MTVSDDTPQTVVEELMASLSHDQILLVEKFAQNERNELEADPGFEWDEWIQGDRSA
jgi:hypothetical protein